MKGSVLYGRMRCVCKTHVITTKVISCSLRPQAPPVAVDATLRVFVYGDMKLFVAGRPAAAKGRITSNRLTDLCGGQCVNA